MIHIQRDEVTCTQNLQRNLISTRTQARTHTESMYIGKACGLQLSYSQKCEWKHFFWQWLNWSAAVKSAHNLSLALMGSGYQLEFDSVFHLSEAGKLSSQFVGEGNYVACVDKL